MLYTVNEDSNVKVKTIGPNAIGPVLEALEKLNEPSTNLTPSNIIEGVKLLLDRVVYNVTLPFPVTLREVFVLVNLPVVTFGYESPPKHYQPYYLYHLLVSLEQINHK